MKNQNTAQSGNSVVGIKRAPYEAPAIIYEGLITTRAGSVPQRPESDGGSGGGADPANIFGGPGG
jgi:hypothetical protein